MALEQHAQRCPVALAGALHQPSVAVAHLACLTFHRTIVAMDSAEVTRPPQLGHGQQSIDDLHVPHHVTVKLMSAPRYPCTTA
jgi:hypothetical protein